MEDMSEAACELQVLGLTGHMAYTEWLGKVSGSDGAERLGREAGARLSAKLDALHTQHSLMELQRLSRAVRLSCMTWLERACNSCVCAGGRRSVGA